MIQSSNLKLDSSLSFEQNQLIEAVSLLAELRFLLADFDQFWAQFGEKILQCSGIIFGMGSRRT